MNTLIKELEALDESLRNTDPGDADVVASLLARRGSVLERLPELCASNEVTPEVLDRLHTISMGMAGLYRGIFLDRLLTRQRLATLNRQESFLRSVSNILEPEPPDRLISEQG